jgi:hypothetical protein
MRGRWLLVVAMTIALTSVSALSAPPRLGGPLVDGSVVRVRGCGVHFFISYHDQYQLAEWLGGEYVKEGDVLVAADDTASFEREGRATFTDLATDRTVDIFIEKALMNRQDFSRKARQVCR